MVELLLADGPTSKHGLHDVHLEYSCRRTDDVCVSSVDLMVSQFRQCCIIGQRTVAGSGVDADSAHVHTENFTCIRPAQLSPLAAASCVS